MKTKPIELITPQMIKPSRKNFRVRGVINPAGVRLPNKHIMLYARIAETPMHDEKTFLAPRFTGLKDLNWTIEKISRKRMEITPDFSLIDSDIYRLPTISHMRKILLAKDGEEVLMVSDSPDFYGLKDDGDFGVEDPRITYLQQEKRYAMTYVSVSMDSGVSTSLATSKNLSTWKRHGIIFSQQNKDVVIFPEKINGYYVALHRPEGAMIFDKPSIWISYSKDLIFWGREKPIIKPRKTGWDHLRIGSGPVPIKTKEGWLELYHGVKLSKEADSDSAKIYSAGAILLDLKDPSKVIARTPCSEPLFEPELIAEKIGFNNRVAFPTAIIPSSNKKDLLIYGGGADSVLTLRKIAINKILNSLR